MGQLYRLRDDNVVLAVAAILFTVLALSLGDALIKQFSADFVLWQIFVLRSVIAIPVLVSVSKLRSRGTSLLPRRIGWTALRSLMLTLMWVSYYAALPQLALATAAAAYYTLPIFITLFAALFIGDRIGVLGWAAVALGFVGVLLILKPQAADFDAYAILPLISAILYALAMILTRTKCKDESPLILSLNLNLSFIAVGLAGTAMSVLAGAWNGPNAHDAFLLGPWRGMDISGWMAMTFMAIAVIIGSVGAAVAYQLGPPAIISTFDFAYVGFAAAWGLLLFAEVPDGVTIAGMVLIVAAGITAVRR